MRYATAGRASALLAGLVVASLLLAPVGAAAGERLPSRARLKKLIKRNGKAAEEWLWNLAHEQRCQGAWDCGRDFEQRKNRAERLYQLYLEFFPHEGGVIRIRIYYGHHLFALKQWSRAAWQYEEAVRLLASAKDPASQKVQKQAAYHALAARAHAAGLADRPLELSQHVRVRERLLAWASGEKLPPPPDRRTAEELDDVLATSNQLMSLLPPRAQEGYALLLAGRAHYEKGETAQAEARFQRLLDRVPQALDTWCVTPLLLDCLVRNNKCERVRKLARQLLEQPHRRWWPALLLEWDQERGRAMLETWKPVFEALAGAKEK